MAKPVSQSRTEWVKKGTVVNGKEVTKGYLAQKGKPSKRVTARVKIVTDTESGKKAGQTFNYKAGRTAGRVKPKATSAGGGRLPGQGPARPPKNQSVAPDGPAAAFVSRFTNNNKKTAEGPKRSIPRGAGSPSSPPPAITAGARGSGPKGNRRAAGFTTQRAEQAARAKRFGAPRAGDSIAKLEKTSTRPGKRPGEYAKIGNVIYVWAGQKWVAVQAAPKR